MKFNEFEWNGQNEGELCYDDLRLKHNRDLSHLKSFFNPETHQVVYARAIRGQYIAKCDNDNDNAAEVDNHNYTGFDENAYGN